MKVVTTNLTIRFYKADGWTFDILVSLLDRLNQEPFIYFIDQSNEYWIPTVGTKLNIDKLMKKVTRVQRTFDDYPNQTDREHLMSKLW